MCRRRMRRPFHQIGSTATGTNSAVASGTGGTLLRNEIEAGDARKLQAATNYAESAIAERHGHGEIAAKIQAHIIMALA
jgi:hypothetical protein